MRIAMIYPSFQMSGRAVDFKAAFHFDGVASTNNGLASFLADIHDL